MIMTYTSDDGAETEQIWNSRDGVTPFIITLRSGRKATHGPRWADDTYAPGHVPAVGARYFCDLTRERAAEIAQANVERWLDDPEMGSMLLERWGSQEAAVAYFTTEYCKPGTPDLREWTQADADRIISR